MVYTTLLIDLDETVYSESCGMWEAMSERMERYMHDRFDLPWEEIPALRRSLYQQYGTTLRGLQMTRHVDERDYLDYVHDVPLDRLLQPDPDLGEMLQRYRQRKIIFTNADRKHARRVLERLDLAHCFDGIIDIYDIAPYCKPMPEAYQIALRLVGVTPEETVFIDNSLRNLAGAHALGIYTIQVGTLKPGYIPPPAEADARIDRLLDLPQLIDPDG